jgi:hypothetical protein
MHDHTPDDVALVPIDRVKEIYPSWPYSSWSTNRLIRAGELGAVCVGRRRFLTKPILMDFLRRHTIACDVATNGVRGRYA